MKFSRFLLRQGCGGQAASKDGVSFYSASLTRRQAALNFIFAMLYYFLKGDYIMAESKLRTLIISVFCIAFLSGCSSSSNISPEIVCGQWQMYATDTERNGKEQKQPITYTFMPNGKYISRLNESTPEETTGKWEIKDGKLLLSEAKNNIAAYTYSQEQVPTFTYVAYEKTFFPKGVTFILRKIVP